MAEQPDEIYAADPIPAQSQLRRLRIRFGLKALFAVVTILCLWLGYSTARNRAADRMINRRNAVLDAIIVNVATPPTDTFYHINPGSQDHLSIQLGRSWPSDQFLRSAVLRTGSSGTLSSQNLAIDVSKLLEREAPSPITLKLLDHYASGLEVLGLNRRQTDVLTRGTGGAAVRGVWTTPANELTVIIDANVSAGDPAGEIQILFIDSQRLDLW